MTRAEPPAWVWKALVGVLAGWMLLQNLSRIAAGH